MKYYYFFNFFLATLKSENHFLLEGCTKIDSGPNQTIVCQPLMSRTVSQTQSFTTNLCHFYHVHVQFILLFTYSFFLDEFTFKKPKQQQSQQQKQQKTKNLIISNNIFAIMGLMC